MEYKKVFKGESNLKDALLYIGDQFNEFHPAGYGTKARLYLDLKGLVVVIDRLESCD